MMMRHQHHTMQNQMRDQSRLDLIFVIYIIDIYNYQTNIFNKLYNINFIIFFKLFKDINKFLAHCQVLSYYINEFISINKYCYILLFYYYFRIAVPERAISQVNMMSLHQPHMHLHRGMHAPLHQQIISLAGHQPMHPHIQHSGPPKQPLLIGTSAQNPNGNI